MSVKIDITNHETGNRYEITNFISYDISQSLFIPADAFNFYFSNINGEISNIITSGDEVKCYIDGNLVLDGIIDDMNVSLSSDSSEIYINGRDKVGILMDNQLEPKTYSKIGLKDFINKMVSPYGFSKISVSSNPKIDKIQINAGDSVWDPIYNYCKDHNLYARYDIDTIVASYLKSTTDYDYVFSNVVKEGIKFQSIDILLSTASVKNKMIVYSDSYDSKNNIKSSATDSSLKIKRQAVQNEPDIESESQAATKAKQALNEANRESFKITLRMYTKNSIKINKIGRVYVPRIGLDAIMLVEEVNYQKSVDSGSITTVKLGLVEGVPVKWGIHDIPTLFYLR